MELVYEYERYNTHLTIHEIVRDFLEQVSECMFCTEEYWTNPNLKILTNEQRTSVVIIDNPITQTNGVVIIKISSNGANKEEIYAQSNFHDQSWFRLGYKFLPLYNEKLH